MDKMSSVPWSTNHQRIEIDITYACPLRCLSCNRSCHQAPTDTRMDVQQIDKFIQESIQKKKQWEMIRIVGGEPALHPRIHDILIRILNYRRVYVPQAKICLVTSGTGETVKNVLKKVPVEYKIENTMQSGEKKYCHVAFNDAPRDIILNHFLQYEKGCEIRSCCGMGLTPSGYYCCAVAGGIDRVLGMDIGRKAMPSENDTMSDQATVICAYCGHFIWGRVLEKKFKSQISNLEKTSRSWNKIYRLYRQGHRPRLLKY